MVLAAEEEGLQYMNALNTSKAKLATVIEAVPYLHSDKSDTAPLPDNFTDYVDSFLCSLKVSLAAQVEWGSSVYGKLAGCIVQDCIYKTDASAVRAAFD